jgi:hypothetical protein
MKTKIFKLVLSAAVAAMVCSVGAYAKDMSNVVVPTKHNKHLTLGQIADMQPGLGTIMIEYSHRFWVAYYAAKNGNWGLAQYELKEMPEIQEVGEVTRPGHAAELKAFEHTYLDKVIDAAKAKDWNKFVTTYAEAVDGCNACHLGTGHSYIRYRLPATPPPSLPQVAK